MQHTFNVDTVSTSNTPQQPPKPSCGRNPGQALPDILSQADSHTSSSPCPKKPPAKKPAPIVVLVCAWSIHTHRQRQCTCTAPPPHTHIMHVPRDACVPCQQGQLQDHVLLCNSATNLTQPPCSQPQLAHTHPLAALPGSLEAAGFLGQQKLTEATAAASVGGNKEGTPFAASRLEADCHGRNRCRQGPGRHLHQ